MKTHRPEIVFAVILSVLCLIAAAYIITTKDASAVTMTFSVPKVATTTLVLVGPGSNLQQLVATSSNCVNRNVSTQNSAVLLSFSGMIPNGGFGTLQAASTSVNYNNGDFGCGAINVYSYASSSLTIQVINQ